jgi:hypothetical protein
MPKINISMKIQIKQNNVWRWIPTGNNHFALDLIAAKGGELRSFRNNQDVQNELIIGSEFTEAKFLGNVVLGRFSDGFSLDLLNLSRTQETINAGVTVWAEKKRVSMVIKSGKISWFSRSMAKGQNYERLKISFESQNAEITYGVDATTVVL